MGWETVKCSECGCSYKVQMYGKQAERDKRVANWDSMCPECNAASRNSDGWTGSGKQIKWAKEIKQHHMDTLTHKKPTGRGAKAFALLEANCSAKFWIDHRLDTPVALLTHIIAINNL